MSMLKLACACVFVSCGAAWSQSVMTIWAQNCLSCHGENGEGGSASSLLNDEYAGGSSNRDLFIAVKDGMPDLGMEAFGEGLSDPQIWATVNYIREMQERARRERVPAPGEIGDVVRGDRHDYRIEPVIMEGLDLPWSVDFLPDGRMLITERDGELLVYEEGGLSRPVRGTPKVLQRGQGGLMDAAPHPLFAENGWVYLSFTESSGGNDSMTKVVRGRLNMTARGGYNWIDEETVFDTPEEMDIASGLHFGCRLVFDGEGRLFFGIGDRGRDMQAQELARPNGKIHRLYDDGRVPADNPFVGREDAMASIWTYGNRNPQGLAYDPRTGLLWITEHGPRGGDELNLAARGANFGWPVVTHGINYSGTPRVAPWPDLTEGLEPGAITMPAHVWLPSTAACGLSIGGVSTIVPEIPREENAFPEWEGDLFSGGLAGQIVERVRVRDGEVVEIEEVVRGVGRVRDVVTSPEGLIYIVLNNPGRVIRLAPVGDG